MMEKRDLLILKYLSKGIKIADMAELMKLKPDTAMSTSSIEKRLNSIKKEYKAKTLFHLAVILKNKNII
nr:hypothetical protein [uncultured Chryseobacterium sp.]